MPRLLPRKRVSKKKFLMKYKELYVFNLLWASKQLWRIDKLHSWLNVEDMRIASRREGKGLTASQIILDWVICVYRISVLTIYEEVKNAFFDISD